MSDDTNVRTHFFHVPIRAVKVKETGATTVIFDFTQVNVTYPVSFILYELTEGPPDARITGVVIAPVARQPAAEPLALPTYEIVARDRLVVVTDLDNAIAKVEAYSISITVTAGKETYTGDPQIINNPIKH